MPLMRREVVVRYICERCGYEKEYPQDHDIRRNQAGCVECKACENRTFSEWYMPNPFGIGSTNKE